MRSPFIKSVGLRAAEVRPGYSRLTLAVGEAHHNSNGVAHGGVAYTVADTGMGAALYPMLEADQRCATIEIKINYFRPVVDGELVCESRVLHKGRTTANIDSELRVGEHLVAKANGTFSIYTARPSPTPVA